MLCELCDVPVWYEWDVHIWYSLLYQKEICYGSLCGSTCRYVGIQHIQSSVETGVFSVLSRHIWCIFVILCTSKVMLLYCCSSLAQNCNRIIEIISFYVCAHAVHSITSRVTLLLITYMYVHNDW